MASEPFESPFLQGLTKEHPDSLTGFGPKADPIAVLRWMTNRRSHARAALSLHERLSAELSAAREMREVLRELEWCATWQHEDEDYREADECPECEHRKHEGHAPDCRLARLIGGGE